MTTFTDFKKLSACEILDQLKFAKFKRLSGETPKRLRYRSDTGAEREIDTINIPMADLDSAITEYTNLCSIEKGETSGRRRCIVAGF